MEGENENDVPPAPAPQTDPEPRQVVGYVWCPKSLADDVYEAAEVRKNIKGKLYIVCLTHSIDLCTSKGAQDWALRNMKEKVEQLKKREVKSDPPPPPKSKEKGSSFAKAIKEW